MITIKYIELVSLVILALISDIRTYKIKNKLILTFIISGLITNIVSDKFEGTANSLLGIIVPFMSLFAFYALSMLGSGDIKLFSAIGSIIGVKPLLYVMAYSFLSGGIIAFIIIIVRKNGRQRIKHLFQYLKCCLLTFSLHPYSDFNDKNDGGTFPFAWAVVCGTLVYILGTLLTII